MNFEGFSSEKIDKYSKQVKLLYGKTEAYQAFCKKPDAEPQRRRKRWGSMTENIDRVCGAGTGAFAKEVIDLYLKD